MESFKKGTGISNKGHEPQQHKKSRFFEEQRKGKAKEDAVLDSCLKKMEAEYAEYLRERYFSGKDIFGGEIFEATSTIDGHTIRASRICPLKSFADPVAYLKEVAEIKKTLTDTRNIEGTSRPPADDKSSESLKELSIDDWNEVESELAKSKALSFKKRRQCCVTAKE